MSLPSLATIDDLADWLGAEIAADDPRATALLLAASTLVRSHTGRTGADDWTESVPDDANVVTVMVAARLWHNPEQVSQESETLGTYALSRSFRADGLYLSSVEKQMLEHYRTRTGVWVQPTTRGDLVTENDTVFLPVLGGDPIPALSEAQPW